MPLLSMVSRAARAVCVERLAALLILSTCGSPVIAQSDTLAQIQRTGVIRMAHRDGAVPFSYADKGGKPLGFTVELCERIAEKVRDHLKMPAIQIQWMQVASADRMKVVKEGKVDMECGSTTNNPERRKQFQFSMPFYLAGIKIMSRKELGAQSVEQLIKRRVAANTGTTAARLMGAGGKGEQFGVQLVETKDHAEAWSLLQEGKVEAWVTDDALLAGYRATSPNPQAYILSDRFLTVEPYGIVMRLEDRELVALANAEITQLMRMGAFRSLYEKWFQKTIPGRNISLDLPMNHLMRAQVASPSEVLPLTF